MWSPPRTLSWELRTKGKSIDEPTIRFYAERKVSNDPLSEGDVRIIIADVDPIANIYDDSGRPSGRGIVGTVIGSIRLVAILEMDDPLFYVCTEVIGCTQQVS